ncbi:hypothetical protein ACLB6G_13145 [Zhengella sp. ZM62]
MSSETNPSAQIPVGNLRLLVAHAGLGSDKGTMVPFTDATRNEAAPFKG